MILYFMGLAQRSLAELFPLLVFAFMFPRDVAASLKQMQSSKHKVGRVQNGSGSVQSAMSLAQLRAWCADRFGKHHVARDSVSRPYDVPWIVLNSTTAKQQLSWWPTISLEQILEEIAQHAEAHPE
jgi:CDP-paratose 2-epimerase